MASDFGQADLVECMESREVLEDSLQVNGITEASPLFFPLGISSTS